MLENSVLPKTHKQINKQINKTKQQNLHQHVSIIKYSLLMYYYYDDNKWIQNNRQNYVARKDPWVSVYNSNC